MRPYDNKGIKSEIVKKNLYNDKGLIILKDIK